MNIVSKVLLPVAAGLLISPALMAADMTNNSQGLLWTNEQLSLADPGDLALGGSIVVVLGEEYSETDIISLRFTGNALDTSTTRTSVSVPCGFGLAGLQLGRLTNTPSLVTYRITGKDETCGDTSTIGQRLEFALFGELAYDAQAVSAADTISVTYSAATAGGVAFDSAGPNNAEVTILTANYLDYLAGPKFGAVVDVNTQRTTLIPGPTDFATVNWVTFVNPDPTAACCISPGFTAVWPTDVVWSGDFSWIVDGNETTAGVQPQPGVVSLGGCDLTSLEVTASAISASCSLTSATLQLNPSVNSVGGDLQTLPATTYTVAVTTNFTDNFWGNGNTGSSTFSALAAGAWTLNGFQARLAYMPYGTGIGQIIYMANRGKQAGAISVDWIDQNGNSGTANNIATIGAGTVLALGSTINAALPAAQRNSGRLALTITANIPSSDGQLNSQYNVSGDRAFVIAETN